MTPEQIEDELRQQQQEDQRLQKIQRLVEARHRTAQRRARIQQLASLPTTNSDPHEDEAPYTTSAPVPEFEIPQRNASHSVPSSTTPSVEDSAASIKPLPMPVNIPIFDATGLKEFHSFINKLENYFTQFEYFYNGKEKSKVTAGAGFLSTDLMNRWTRENKNLNKNRTRDEFKNFCKKEVSDPWVMQRDAAAAFQRADQREYQTVTELANYLDTLEDKLPERYSNTQRKMHLYAKLRPEVQREAQRPAQEPEDYHDFVSYLKSCEGIIPERRTALRNARTSRVRSTGRPRQAPTTVRVGSKGPWRSQPFKRKRSFENQQRSTTPICFKCSKGRHNPNFCRSAPDNPQNQQAKN